MDFFSARCYGKKMQTNEDTTQLSGKLYGCLRIRVELDAHNLDLMNNLDFQMVVDTLLPRWSLADYSHKQMSKGNDCQK